MRQQPHPPNNPCPSFWPPAAVPSATDPRAPLVLYLGVYNSLEEKQAESVSGVCRVTLFAPYWINNRTGGWLGWAVRLAGVGRGRLPVELIVACFVQSSARVAVGSAGHGLR